MGSSQSGGVGGETGGPWPGGSKTVADAHKAASVTCRLSAGQCDVAETCTGTSGTCPADAFQSATTHCMGSSQSGVCDDDTADHCSGSSNTCVDAYKAASVTCRPSAGQCDVGAEGRGAGEECTAGGLPYA